LDDGCHDREGIHIDPRLVEWFHQVLPASCCTASTISRKFFCGSRITTLALLLNTALPADLRVI
jgi:hypothetical protein